MSAEWDESARDELADYWVAATPEERERMEAAVLRLEAELRGDPAEVGESRHGNFRVVHIPPLSFWFRVPPDGSTATVVRVVWLRRPR